MLFVYFHFPPWRNVLFYICTPLTFLNFVFKFFLVFDVIHFSEFDNSIYSHFLLVITTPHGFIYSYLTIIRQSRHWDMNSTKNLFFSSLKSVSLPFALCLFIEISCLLNCSIIIALTQKYHLLWYARIIVRLFCSFFFFLLIK